MTHERTFSHDNRPRLGELLTVEEVAALLKVDKSWVYARTRRRGSERLPHVKLGKYLRFDEKSIHAYLERRKCE